jgi:sugar O-acyltransferase (sialic acid O-acetyltransferase NeuD family)
LTNKKGKFEALVKKSIGLLGFGNQAKEVLDFAKDFNVDFVVSSLTDEKIVFADGLTIESHLFQTNPKFDLPVLPAVGAPGLKRSLIELWPGNDYISVISDTSWVSKHASIDVGSIISPGSIVMQSCVIGKFVLVNIGATISHDSRIGEYSTISPGVNIAGYCDIGSGVFIGIGATVSHGITIADGTFIGAGANVIKNIDVPGTYVGNPALKISDENVWSVAL